MKPRLILLASLVFLILMFLSAKIPCQVKALALVDVGFNAQDTLPDKNKGKPTWVDSLRHPDTLYQEYPATPVIPDTSKGNNRQDTMTGFPERYR